MCLKPSNYERENRKIRPKSTKSNFRKFEKFWPLAFSYRSIRRSSYLSCHSNFLWALKWPNQIQNLKLCCSQLGRYSRWSALRHDFLANFLFFFHRKGIFRPISKLNKKSLEIILEKSVTYDSVHLHLLFSTVKTSSLSGFYQNFFKKYSWAFMLSLHMRTKQILFKFYYYNIGWRKIK